MSVKTYYPTSVSQSSGGKFRKFKDLNNIKNSKNTYAISEADITKKDGSHNTPSDISCTNFNVSLPSGSEITKIVVEYKFKKTATVKDKYPSLPAPVISLLNSGNTQYKGSAPTKTLKGFTKTFKGTKTGKKKKVKVNTTVNGKKTVKTKEVDVLKDFETTKVQNSSFGVKFEFPKNTNNYTGKLEIQFIRIKVHYREPSYKISFKKVNSDAITANSDLELDITINNVNKTKINPTVLIQLPLNVSYVKATGKGTVTKGSDIRLNWNPKLSDKVLSSTIRLKVSCDTISSNNNIVVSESVAGTHKNYTFNILESPTSITETDSDDSDNSRDVNRGDNTIKPIIVQVLEEFTGNLILPLDVQELIQNIGQNYKGYVMDYVTFAMIYKDYNGQQANNVILIPSEWGLQRYFEDPRYTGWLNVPPNSNTIKMISSPQEVTEINLPRLRFSQVGLYNIPLSIFIHVEGGAGYLEVIEFGYLPVLVIPPESELSLPYLTILQLSTEELCRLGSGINYTLQSLFKLVSSEEYVRDWYKNFRIGVFNNAIQKNITISSETDEITGEVIETVHDSTDYDSLSVEDIFENADYWSDCVSALNEFKELLCEFTYNQNYPLYILIVGDYFEGNPTENEVIFTEPCIVESEYYNGREDNGNFPIPIEATILTEDQSHLEINLLTESNKIIFYDLPVGDDYGTNEHIAIQGILLTADIDYTDDLTVTANLKVKNSNNEEIMGSRSIVLNQDNKDTLEVNEMTNTLIIGGAFDTWGINKGDLINLKDAEIEVSFKNIFENDTATILFSNTQITIFSTPVINEESEIIVEGENIKWYGAFVNDASIPIGLNTNVKYLNNEGTDVNTAFIQTVKEKTITLEIDISGCNLEDTTGQALELIKLFTNKRDELNRPIPKTIEFSHIPGKYAEYIIKDDTDSNINITDNILKIKLEIPSGVFYDKEETVTGNIGAVTGITKVNPRIIVIPSSKQITITEEYTGQKWTGESDDWIGKTVEIDCETRSVWITASDDESEMLKDNSVADWSNDWFILQHGEYNFSEIGCIIRQVIFTERS